MLRSEVNPFLNLMVALTHRLGNVNFSASSEYIIFVGLFRYDNEYGYSHRVIDLLNYVYSQDHKA